MTKISPSLDIYTVLFHWSASSGKKILVCFLFFCCEARSSSTINSRSLTQSSLLRAYKPNFADLSLLFCTLIGSCEIVPDYKQLYQTSHVLISFFFWYCMAFPSGSLTGWCLRWSLNGWWPTDNFFRSNPYLTCFHP